jgi:hypothetical protein
MINNRPRFDSPTILIRRQLSNVLRLLSGLDHRNQHTSDRQRCFGFGKRNSMLCQVFDCFVFVPLIFHQFILTSIESDRLIKTIFTANLEYVSGLHQHFLLESNQLIDKLLMWRSLLSCQSLLQNQGALLTVDLLASSAKC